MNAERCGAWEGKGNSIGGRINRGQLGGEGVGSSPSAPEGQERRTHVLAPPLPAVYQIRVASSRLTDRAAPANEHFPASALAFVHVCAAALRGTRRR